MYEQYYKLEDSPFGPGPDPAYLFFTPGVQEVLAALHHAIERGKGLIILKGEGGTGKTTILRWLFHRFERSVRLVYLSNSRLSVDEFLEEIATGFELDYPKPKGALWRALTETVSSRHARGLKSVLVIDEAQGLSPYVLEEIRLLSNLESDREKLLQIILSGQPELHDILNLPEFRQLKQRVSIECSLQPLTEDETCEYIRARLLIAKAADTELFSPGATKLIYELSGGIPRLINKICDRALLIGFSSDTPIVSAKIIEEVSEDFDLLPHASIVNQRSSFRFSADADRPRIFREPISSGPADSFNMTGLPEIKPEPPEYDLFLSHASEDKNEIARPLYVALRAKGVSVWFDEAELTLGDHLRRKIDSGLSKCRYGIVILSPSFFSKEWPRSELDGLVARESTGEKRILPIWHRLDRAEVLKYSPMLADRLAGRSDEGVDVLVSKLLDVLQR